MRKELRFCESQRKYKLQNEYSTADIKIAIMEY